MGVQVAVIGPAETAPPLSGDVQTLEINGPEPQPRLLIRLDDGSFCALWCVILGFEITVVAFLFFFVRMYWKFSTPAMKDMRTVFGFPSVLALRLVALSYFIICAFYIWTIYTMIAGSIKRRRLAFRDVRKPPPPTKQGQSIWLDCMHSVRRLYTQLFSRQGLFGIEYRYFNAMLVVRKLMEITSQSYQAYKLSTLVPRAWVNMLSSLMIIANCWSTPLIRYILRHNKNETVQRVLCIGIDILLTFISSVVVPGILLAPYLNKFDTKRIGVSDALLADSTWFLSVEMTLQQVRVTGLWDYLTKIMPLISILGSFRGFTEYLATFSALSVLVLEFSHCWQLQMPPAIRQLTRLVEINTFNCTIESWDESAAIDANDHRQIIRVSLIRTNVSAVPSGLLQTLPPTLRVINLIATNLTTLPPSIANTWHEIMSLHLEHGILVDFPAAVLDLLWLDRLSIAHNRIEEMPARMTQCVEHAARRQQSIACAAG
ncbi:TPA: hypothetical protein N0F65_003059 [Lagenidium giganteum]|uniref:Uncharacterized protein n=1 Tax=Lagenidium giganteum TaxID=4803 RepID=A0AAV2YGQ8_9STRA|nr:TPA: hypothetical protein N0F65_003059 [Lagenidium giganteum]